MAEKADYNPIHRFVEISAIAAYLAILFYWMFLMVSYDIWGSPVVWVGIASAIFVGLVCADFVSGFVHWLADRFGHVDMFILGDAFIRPFREHHDDPTNICEHDFIEVNGNNCVTILLFLPFVATLHYLTPRLFQIWLEAWTIAFTIAIFFTNQIHSWAHADEAPALVRWLQKYNLILSPRHHDVHHEPPHLDNYCITLGWMNAPLAKIDFFGRAYRFVRTIQGRPTHDPHHQPAPPAAE